MISEYIHLPMSGGVIAAPCKDRGEAVVITNKLKAQNGDYA